MSKRVVYIILFLIFALSGCSNSGKDVTNVIVMDEMEKNTNYEEETQVLFGTYEEYSVDVMDGMEFILEGDTDGYLLQVKGQEVYGEGIVLIDEDNELNVLIENVGERRLALKIMVDYVQVPMIIDGEEYDVYYVDSKEKMSERKTVKLNTDIDRSLNHKITAILYRDIQVHAGEEETWFMEGEALTMDMLLVCNEKNEEIARTEIQYEDEIKVYEDEFDGINITQDENGMRKVIKDSINVKPGENLKFNYHVGGFQDSTETVIFMDIGEEQQKINGKDFLLCNIENSKIMQGEFEVQAPLQEGKYEAVLWAVNNPYGDIAGRIQDVRGSFRFTINVEK